MTAPLDEQEIKLPDFAPFFNRETPKPAGRKVESGYLMDVDEGEYRKHPAINASILKEATCCEMLHALTTPSVMEFTTEAAAKKWTTGLILHDAVLQPFKFLPENFDKHFVKWTETKGIATKKAQECRQENPGKLLINGDYFDVAMRCMDAIAADPKAVELLKIKSHREAVGVVWDGPNAVWRKLRHDILPVSDNCLIDIKTTADPLYSFADRVAPRFGYYLQAAWYLDTHFLLTGERREVFWWIVVTKEEPFMCKTFWMQNLPKDHALYKDDFCRYRKARERLGLDASERLGRLPMFLSSARETVQLAAKNVKWTALQTRRTWPGYEQMEPELIF